MGNDCQNILHADTRKALQHLIDETRRGKMFGEWNDYGRLLEY